MSDKTIHVGDVLAQALCDITPRRQYYRAIRAERRAEAAEIKCEQVREATGRLLDMLALSSVKFSLDGSDAWAQFHKAWTDTHTALAAEDFEATVAADQQNEREDETAHDPSYDAGWNAGIEAAARLAYQRICYLYGIDVGDARDDINAIRSLKRNTS